MSKAKFDFGAFTAQLVNTKVEPKKIGVLPERRYFLIVTEGIRTEPIYFEYIGKMLPKHLVSTVEIKGAGDNTIRVVQKAIELREKRIINKTLPAYDEVWAVYDKDDFPASRYNEAINLANREGIESGHSNQSFELWYVLHFEYLQSALHRTDYIKKLTEYLGFKYIKRTQKVVETLMEQGNVQRAIKWAKDLEILNQEKTASDSCPYTRVYVLVDRLLNYIDHTTDVNS